MPTEYGWLLEKAPDGKVGPEYYTLDPEIRGFYTPDHHKALRFAREVDAKNFREYLEVDEAKPVEHGWG